jgi:ATP-dependent Zn protease
MTDAHAEAHRILAGHRDMLENVTRRLLDVEVMEGAELRRILDGQPVVSTQDDPVQASPPADAL